MLELSENGKARVARPKECVNCGFCELHCPDFAILLRPLDMANGKNGLHPLNGGNGGGATRTQAR